MFIILSLYFLKRTLLIRQQSLFKQKRLVRFLWVDLKPLTSLFFYNIQLDTRLVWTKYTHLPASFYFRIIFSIKRTLRRLILYLRNVRKIYYPDKKKKQPSWLPRTAPSVRMAGRLYFFFLLVYLRWLYYFLYDVYFLFFIYKTFFFKDSFRFLKIKARYQQWRLLLTNSLHAPLILITPGLYYLFLHQNKRFKKTKTLRIVLFRFLRKILVCLNFTSLWLINFFRPIFLNELFFYLVRKIENIFFHPFLKKYLTEETLFFRLYWHGVFFYKVQAYSILRTKKYRFLKRKIRRRFFQT